MTATDKKWETTGESIYEQFRIFTAKRSTRVNPRTGKPFDFFLMEGLDWVNIIPITENNEVVLVRQYRHGSETFTIETPGGVLEAGEDPKFAALRELREETGYSATDAQFLGTLDPNPAMQKMKISFFVAHNVKLTGEQALDPGEDISIILKPLNEIHTAILRGEMTHALVVAAFGLLAFHEKNR